MAEFIRRQAGILKKRIAEPRRFIQVVSGPRQVGKTTLVRQAASAIGIPVSDFLAKPVEHWIKA